MPRGLWASRRVAVTAGLLERFGRLGGAASATGGGTAAAAGGRAAAAAGGATVAAGAGAGSATVGAAVGGLPGGEGTVDGLIGACAQAAAATEINAAVATPLSNCFMFQPPKSECLRRPERVFGRAQRSRDNAQPNIVLRAAFSRSPPYRRLVQFRCEIGSDISGQPPAVQLEVGQEQVAADPRRDRRDA